MEEIRDRGIPGRQYASRSESLVDGDSRESAARDERRGAGGELHSVGEKGVQNSYSAAAVTKPKYWST
ncbi:hypothetical protein C8Q80DRAFT_1187924 [Daedaleopsis nitida]|nr:hypothetical protein C8Q80DRAFT_1187924 [Daedaleopsis nitida]